MEHNSSGQLGPGPTENTESFKPIWPEACWIKVFAASDRCLGIKTDATTWTWGGQVRYAPTKTIPDFQLKPSEFTGTNWTSFATGEIGELALATRGDNTLWAFAPDKLIDAIGRPWTIFGESIDKPGLHQLGTKHDW